MITNQVEVVADILVELDKATTKFPNWPIDPLHAASVIGEENGELIRAILQAIYEPDRSNIDDVRKEAIQTAAMCIRFLMNLDKYEFTGCKQSM